MKKTTDTSLTSTNKQIILILHSKTTTMNNSPKHMIYNTLLKVEKSITTKITSPSSNSIITESLNRMTHNTLLKTNKPTITRLKMIIKPKVTKSHTKTF